MDWRADLDGYTTEFVEVHVDADLTELLKGLPGDVCPSPHWGYVFKGSLTVRYADHEETFQAGDAFYMPPGHAPAAEAGTAANILREPPPSSRSVGRCAG